MKSKTRWFTIFEILLFVISDIGICQKSKDEPESCGVCRSVVGILIEHQRDGSSDMENFALELCLSLDYYLPDTCKGYIKLNLPIFVYIIEMRPMLTEATICGIFLQSSGCIINDTEYLEWSVEIDPNGAPIEDHKRMNFANDSNFLKIIQISDIHYDPFFTIGSNANCDDFMCCRSGIPDSQGDAAHRWGGYRCDSPWNVVVDTLDQISKQHDKIDYIYFTGDIIHHSPWNSTVNEIKNSFDKILQHFKNIFGDIPIFPVLGNHDVHPQNQFAPSTVPDHLNTQWLYNYLAEKYSTWLPVDTKPTIQQGGFYTVLIRPGFRVIALNNNDCNTDNFWLAYEPEYLSIQLQWLHDILLKSEKYYEKVHILMHTPSGGNGCWKIWAREFRRIVDRFWNIISGIFTGHSHKDDFNVFYDRKSSMFAINLAWNGGSTTTITNINPNYKLYAIETKSLHVIDFDVWSYNLTEANQTPDQSPRWFKAYSFRDEYQVDDLSPYNIDKLVNDFSENNFIVQRFWEHRSKRADPTLNAGCSETCLTNMLCSIVTTEYGDDRQCVVD